MAEHIHTFAGNPLDRGEDLRRDETALRALIEHPDSLFLPFQRLQVAIDARNQLDWLTQQDIRRVAHEQMVFLGTRDGRGHFAVSLAGEADHLSFEDCRTAAGQVTSVETGILAQARSQLDWHRRNGFCAECGNPSRPERGGQIRRCTACDKHIFPRTDPVAIMLIIDEPGGDRCLLGQSQGRMAHSNFYSALAGFLDQGESLEEAVRREVREESGVRVGEVRYHSSQPWPFPAQLMIGCHGVAAVSDIQINEAEMADVQWFSRDEVNQALQGTNDHLRVPGPLAIAHHLIRSWVEGEVRI